MTVHIAILHRFNTETPSLRNLKQGLAAADESWRITTHSLRPDLPTDTMAAEAAQFGLFSLNALRKYFSFRLIKKPDAVIIHKTLYGELFSRILGPPFAERLLTKFDNTVYSTYDADYIEFPDKAELLFSRSDLILCTSKAIEQRAAQTAPTESIVYIPPSVDTEFFAPVSPVPEEYSSDSFVLGWIGNAAVHEQNLLHLAAQLNLIEDEDLILRLLLGGASLTDPLQQAFDQLSIPVETINYVDWERVPAVISSFDVGLVPLRDTEFDRARSSEKAREYMACGVPVIGSDIGENCQLITDETGILVNSPSEWSEAVESLQNEGRRDRMSRAARTHVEENFSTDVIGEQLRSRLDELV